MNFEDYEHQITDYENFYSRMRKLKHSYPPYQEAYISRTLYNKGSWLRFGFVHQVLNCFYKFSQGNWGEISESEKKEQNDNYDSAKCGSPGVFYGMYTVGRKKIIIEGNMPLNISIISEKPRALIMTEEDFEYYKKTILATQEQAREKFDKFMKQPLQETNSNFECHNCKNKFTVLVKDEIIEVTCPYCKDTYKVKNGRRLIA